MLPSTHILPELGLFSSPDIASIGEIKQPVSMEIRLLDVRLRASTSTPVNRRERGNLMR